MYCESVTESLVGDSLCWDRVAILTINYSVTQHRIKLQTSGGQGLAEAAVIPVRCASEIRHPIVIVSHIYFYKWRSNLTSLLSIDTYCIEYMTTKLCKFIVATCINKYTYRPMNCSLPS